MVRNRNFRRTFRQRAISVQWRATKINTVNIFTDRTFREQSLAGMPGVRRSYCFTRRLSCYPNAGIFHILKSVLLSYGLKVKKRRFRRFFAVRITNIIRNGLLFVFGNPRVVDNYFRASRFRPRPLEFVINIFFSNTPLSPPIRTTCTRH